MRDGTKCGQNAQVDEIAALCSMSTPNLAKTFSRYTGMGVMSYFNSLKMSKAVELLKSGVSIKETSARLGFLNQNYFSTVFKRTMGLSPSEAARSSINELKIEASSEK